jgi:glycerol kinase
MSTGTQLTLAPENGLVSTAHGKFFGEMRYALEGADASAGSAVDWAKQLFLIESAQIESMATSVQSSDGVYCVPANSGLFTPYWDYNARTLFIGMTRSTTREHMMRSVLEGIAYRASEILKLMKQDSGFTLDFCRVDGGMTKNAFFLQTMADLASCQIQLPAYTETTVLGAALCAAMGVGKIESLSAVSNINVEFARNFDPSLDEATLTANWS